MTTSKNTRYVTRRRTSVMISTLALTSVLFGSQLTPVFAGDELAAEPSAPVSTTENSDPTPNTETTPNTEPAVAPSSSTTSPADATNETPTGNLITDQRITQSDVMVTLTSAKVAITAKSGGIYRMDYYGTSYPLSETPNGNGTSRYSVNAENLMTRPVAQVVLYFKPSQDGTETSTVLDAHISVLKKLTDNQGALPILPNTYTGQVSDADRAQIVNNVTAWYRAAGYDVLPENITTNEQGVAVRVDTFPPPAGWDRHFSQLVFQWPIFYAVRSTKLTVTNWGIGSEVRALGQGSVSVSYDGRTFVKERKRAVDSASKIASYILSVTSADLKPWAEPFSQAGSDPTVTLAYTMANGETHTRTIDLTSSQLWFRKVGAALAKDPLPKIVVDEKFDCSTDDSGKVICPRTVLTKEQVEEYKKLIAKRLDAAGIPYTNITSYANNYPLFVNLPTETIDGTTVVDHRYYFDDLVEVRRTVTTELPAATEYRADDSLAQGKQRVEIEGAPGSSVQSVIDSVKNGAITLDANTRTYTYEALSTRNDGAPRITEPTTRVIAVGTKPTVTTEEIPFTTEYVDDASLAPGEEKVLVEGVNGSRTTTTTYTVDAQTGELSESTSVNETAPTAKRIARGTTVAQTPNTPATSGTAETNGHSAAVVSGKSPARTLVMTGSSVSGHIAIAAAALLMGGALMLIRRRVMR